MPIVVGDARLTLADAPDGHYDVILIDAFASDTMPVHLMTKEAMAIYLRKLKPDGLIALHVSSRYMELVSVVAGIAQANGLDGASQPARGSRRIAYHYSSSVVAAARAEKDFAIAGQPGRLDRGQTGSPSVGLDRRLFQRDRRNGPPLAAIAAWHHHGSCRLAHRLLPSFHRKKTA